MDLPLPWTRLLFCSIIDSLKVHCGFSLFCFLKISIMNLYKIIIRDKSEVGKYLLLGGKYLVAIIRRDKYLLI